MSSTYALDRLIRSMENIEFRTYQSIVAEKTVQAFEEFQSVMIEAPTGCGKTIMALLIAKYMQEQHGYSIGWVAMRRNLLTQVAVENVQKNFNLNIEFISMFEQVPPQVDFLIVDEAHHDPTNSMINLHGLIKPKKFLGLTATPFRADKLAIPYDKTIRETNIFQLIRDGFLSDFIHYSIPEWTPEQVAATYLSDRDHWGKSVMFFHKERECRKVEEMLKSHKVRCEVVTHKTDRNRQLDMFDDGKIDVLINMLILTEGFDCPDLETVFVRPSNKNASVQMCGRVLRKFDGIDKKIVQCQQTKHPFCSYAPSKYRYLWQKEHTEWFSLDTDFRHELVKQNMIAVLSQCEADTRTLDEIRGISAYNKRQVERVFQELEEEENGSSIVNQELEDMLVMMHGEGGIPSPQGNVSPIQAKQFTLSEDVIAFKWVCEQVDSREIASRLGRSEQTIKGRYYTDGDRGLKHMFRQGGFSALYKHYGLVFSTEDLVDRVRTMERLLLS